jgi:hypothetical protein
MFHYKEDQASAQEIKSRIKKAFITYSSSPKKDYLTKNDFKTAWLYLFGYKTVCLNAHRMRLRL